MASLTGKPTGRRFLREQFRFHLLEYNAEMDLKTIKLKRHATARSINRSERHASESNSLVIVTRVVSYRLQTQPNVSEVSSNKA